MATETFRERRETFRIEENSFLHYLTGPFARVLFAMPFLVFGFNHFIQGDSMAGMIPFPGGGFWSYFVGVCLIAASVAIIFNVVRTFAAIALGMLMVVIILTIHMPILMTEGTSAVGAVTGALKDTALAGAAFYMAGMPQR